MAKGEWRGSCDIFSPLGILYRHFSAIINCRWINIFEFLISIAKDSASWLTVCEYYKCKHCCVCSNNDDNDISRKTINCVYVLLQGFNFGSCYCLPGGQDGSWLPGWPCVCTARAAWPRTECQFPRPLSRRHRWPVQGFSLPFLVCSLLKAISKILASFV